VNAPLPLKITSFTGIVEQTNVHLFWKTTGSNGIRLFDIERSVDGVSFQHVIRKDAINTQDEISYDIIDLNANQFGKKLYYRLKTEELDGKIAYSTILVFEFNQNTGILAIYPNPSDGLFYLTVQASSVVPLDFAVFNLFGHKIQNYHYSKAGNYTLDLSQQPAGIYFIKTSDGVVHKLILQ
jgi:hypothetical protein